MSEHARLSPSSAHRWMACAASLRLEQPFPNTSSKYADEGTAAHTLAAMALTEGLDAHAYLGRILPAGEREFEVDDDMANAVQDYVEAVRAIAGPNMLLVEQRVDFSEWLGVPESFGTSDAVIIADDELVLVDLKFGRGVEVSAQENEQLRLYALGALHSFSAFGEFQRVRMVIHQPRLNHVDEWVDSVETLAEFGAKAKAAAGNALNCMRSAIEPLPSDYGPGEKSCRWCKAKAVCPAARGEVIRTVFQRETVPATPADFEDVTQDVVPPQQHVNDWLQWAMGQAAFVEDWLKGVRAEVERRLLDGQQIPGYKLVRGKQGNRQWSDEEAAEQLMKSTFRMKQDEMYDFKLISPTVAEKRLAESPKRWAKLEQLVTRSEGKLSVAPESDKRPAVSPQATPEDFATVTHGEDLIG